MAKAVNRDPVELLLDMDSRSKANAAGLPQQKEVKQEWLGIGFRIGEMQFVAPLDEVAELLTYPSMSKVPGAKSWVKGIANVRGNLLPVMDLNAYLSHTPTMLSSQSRVLVVDYMGVYSGLLVDEVLGLKHFIDEERTRSLPEVDTFIKSYLRGSYIQDGEQWGVFSLYALAESPFFMQVAV